MIKMVTWETIKTFMTLAFIFFLVIIGMLVYGLLKKKLGFLKKYL